MNTGHTAKHQREMPGDYGVIIAFEDNVGVRSVLGSYAYSPEGAVDVSLHTANVFSN